MDFATCRYSLLWGAITGILWGLISLVVNTISGVFNFEDSLLGNMVTFAIAGVIFGIIANDFLSLTYRWIPFKNIFLKAIFITIILWVVLRVGGVLLSIVEPDKHHLITAEMIQGFILFIVLGGLLGFLWKIKSKEA